MSTLKTKRNQDKVDLSEETKRLEFSWIGIYSMDKDEYKNDMSSLKYLKIPEVVNINLNESLSQKKASDNSFLIRLKQMIKFIEENYDKVKGDQTKPIAADFVCTRGVMKKIMEFKYFPLDFKVYTAILKGTIYLALEYDDIDYLDFNKFGNEFEKQLLSSKFDGEPGDTEDKEFCVVIERIIDDLKILFNVECDGIVSKIPINNLEDLKAATIVELKTRNDRPNNREKSQFGWLIQSHVAGIIAKVYEGRRLDGIVQDIIIHDLKQLEDEGKLNGYDINQCYAYLGNFLIHVKAKMTKVENAEKVFVYNFIKFMY